MSEKESIPPINSSEDYDKLTPEQQAEVDSWGSDDLDDRLSVFLDAAYMEELRKRHPDLEGEDDKMGAA